MEADQKKGCVNSGERVTPVSYDTSGTSSASLPQKDGVKQAQTGSQWALGEKQVRYRKAELRQEGHNAWRRRQRYHSCGVLFRSSARISQNEGVGSLTSGCSKSI